MLKFVLSIGGAALLGSGLLFAHLRLGMDIPGIDRPALVKPTSPHSRSIAKKNGVAATGNQVQRDFQAYAKGSVADMTPDIEPKRKQLGKRETMAGRKIEAYRFDEHTLALAKRTAASMGRRGKVSTDAFRLYRDTVSRAERSCRFQSLQACSHRWQLAQLAREPKANGWLRKTKTLGADIMKGCRTAKSSEPCRQARKVLKELESP